MNTTEPTSQKPRDLRRQRKERSEAAELELAGVMLNHSSGFAERAIAALGVLSDKIAADVEEQRAEIEDAKRAGSRERVEAEVSRLLRMLERRARLVEELARALENSAKRG
jgi:hypothetical protein